MTTRILFICTGNSARSQMAEGLARQLAAPGVEVASAGTHPVGISPLARAAMRDRGIDISAQTSKRIEDVPGVFDYVVTLCDAAARDCPVLPARQARVHWPIPDPGAVAGGDAERLRVFSQVREDIERRLRQWLREIHLLGEAR